MTDEIKTGTETKEFKKGNKDQFLRYVAMGLVVVTLIVLVIVKIKKPEVSTLWILLPGAAVIAVALILLFWHKISETLFSNKHTLDNKLPGTITQEQAFKIVKDFIESDVFENHIKSYEAIRPYNPGKNNIYEFKCELLYDSPKQKGILSVFINANYPNKIPAFEFNTTNSLAKGIANRISESPEDEPDTEVTETKRDPLTGEVISREVKKSKKKKESTKEAKLET